MPYLVNGQLVPEELIRGESARIGRDPQWQSIPDLTERANRLRAAAEQCAQDRILIEQAARNDPRPIDPAALEQEVARQNAQWGCRVAFDNNALRRMTERNLRVQRIRQEMVAGAIKPAAEDIEAFFNANRQNFQRPEFFHASHIVKYVNHEQSEEQAEAGMHYIWLKKDPEYAAAFEIGWKRGADALKAEAVRRAFEGVSKPLFHGGKRAIDVVQNPDGSIKRDKDGKPVGIPAAMREYSDILLIFLLKGRNPAVFGDRIKQEISANVTVEQMNARLAAGRQRAAKKIP